MAKRTKEETIKALDLCVNHKNEEGHCDNCPYVCYAYGEPLHSDDTNCDEELMKDALKYLLERKENEQWINCKVRMPEKEDFYWVQDKSGNISKIWYSENYNAFMGVNGPIAWRPMPKKYVPEN